MRVFVTGGTGFVGANLIRLLLAQGHSVKALVRPQSNLANLQGLDVELIEGDLHSSHLVTSMKGCQVLFHVAACYSLWQRDRNLLYQSNVLGTENILHHAKDAGIERTVYTSSVAAIGVGEAGNPINETHQSPVEKLTGYYKKSKYYAEQKALTAAKSGQDVVIVNPTTPIGAWDIKPTPTGEIIVRFLERKMPFYVDTGLNLIDVEDVAWGHLLAMDRGISGDRYILGNQNLTLKQILDKLATITGLSAPKSTIPYVIPYGVAWLEEKILAPLGKKTSIAIDGVKMSRQKMFYDPSKAIQQLGLPQSSVDLALTKAVRWFQRNKIEAGLSNV